MPRCAPRVLAAACALLAVLAGGAAAETAVGIEARGVDPMVALQNSHGLDLRDELGRPVSPKLIAAELKAAQAQAAADAAFSSRLPSARSMARTLELWRASLFSFAAGLPRLPWRALLALPAPKPGSRAAVLLVLLAACAICRCTVCRCRSFLPGSFSGAPVALRC
ncbi:MAG: hypothetical protein HY926_07530 [Elusimicrobia bacterium]|nr:hypothetical protein [Elusimicrobiota bacterium]